ncbi:MAG: FixH family protein [Alphaproteobacteria bacterium]|nr:FixH family protein [Alphaproteobacteria bacterium]
MPRPTHALALLLLACAPGSDEHDHDAHDTDAHDTDHHEHTGTEDTAADAVDTYVDGLQKQGGHVKVAITLDPAPSVGTHDVTLVVLHHGAAAEGFDVTLDATMPAHGHGTSPVTVTESSTPGTYTATGLDLTMPGLWQLDVGVWMGDHGGDVVFRFEVP